MPVKGDPPYFFVENLDFEIVMEPLGLRSKLTILGFLIPRLFGAGVALRPKK